MIRNYRRGDEHGWLKLVQAAPDFPYAIFNRAPSLDALRMMLEHPHIDAERNLFFAEAGDRLVGFAELWHAPGQVRHIFRLLVHPDWRCRGLGTSLLWKVERRARQLGGQYLDVQIESSQEVGRRFLAARGLRPVHCSWQMHLTDLAAVPQPDWPPGYSQRAFVPGEDECTSVQLENECFREEWEHVPVELGEIVGFVRSPSFRADGVIYAVHQGRVVGECWCWIEETSLTQRSEKQGYVWCLCVHPNHRGRGLGRALLLSGLQWLRQRNMSSAALHVDGANERAKRLYEGVGFRVRRTDIWYREAL